MPSLTAIIHANYRRGSEERKFLVGRFAWKILEDQTFPTCERLEPI